MKCFAPGCELAGTKWPTIVIPQRDRLGEAYRLQVPRAVCDAHQPEFRPDTFLTEGSRDYMRFLAHSWNLNPPLFDGVVVEWAPIEDPIFRAFDGTEARFCAPEPTR